MAVLTGFPTKDCQILRIRFSHLPHGSHFLFHGAICRFFQWWFLWIWVRFNKRYEKQVLQSFVISAAFSGKFFHFHRLSGEKKIAAINGKQWKKKNSPLKSANLTKVRRKKINRKLTRIFTSLTAIFTILSNFYRWHLDPKQSNPLLSINLTLT